MHGKVITDDYSRVAPQTRRDPTGPGQTPAHTLFGTICHAQDSGLFEGVLTGAWFFPAMECARKESVNETKVTLVSSAKRIFSTVSSITALQAPLDALCPRNR
jgi:hypothetical protein